MNWLDRHFNKLALALAIWLSASAYVALRDEGTIRIGIDAVNQFASEGRR